MLIGDIIKPKCMVSKEYILDDDQRVKEEEDVMEETEGETGEEEDEDVYREI